LLIRNLTFINSSNYMEIIFFVLIGPKIFFTFRKIMLCQNIFQFYFTDYVSYVTFKIEWRHINILNSEFKSDYAGGIRFVSHVVDVMARSSYLVNRFNRVRLVNARNVECRHPGVESHRKPVENPSKTRKHARIIRIGGSIAIRNCKLQTSA